MRKILNVIAFSGLFTIAVAGVVNAENLDRFVSGIDRVRSDIVANKYPWSGAGPWRIKFTGDTPDAWTVAVIPKDAFKTEQEADPRNYIVTLTNPSALLTSAGNLRNIGIEVTESTSGRGKSFCQVGVEFRTTGTNQLIDLEEINNTTPSALKFTLNPSSAATFVRYDGAKAIIQRKSGDKSTLTATLQLFDEGQWLTFRSEPLALCGESVVAPPVPAPVKKCRWEESEGVERFWTATETSSVTEFFDARYYACGRAKEELSEWVSMNCDYPAAERRFAQGSTAEGYVVEVKSVDPVANSLSASCECESLQRGYSTCWSCSASGKIQCEATLRIKVRVCQ